MNKRVQMMLSVMRVFVCSAGLRQWMRRSASAEDTAATKADVVLPLWPYHLVRVAQQNRVINHSWGGAKAARQEWE